MSTSIRWTQHVAFSDYRCLVATNTTNHSPGLNSACHLHEHGLFMHRGKLQYDIHLDDIFYIHSHLQSDIEQLTFNITNWLFNETNAIRNMCLYMTISAMSAQQNFGKEFRTNTTIFYKTWSTSHFCTSVKHIWLSVQCTYDIYHTYIKERAFKGHWKASQIPKT